MQVYKLKAFARFQRRERIADAALARAVTDAAAGRIDADLGGGLVKQRLARPGQGKSGGFRTVIAFRRGERAVFLFGFAKSDLDNLDDDELAHWQNVGEKYLRLSGAAIEEALAARELLEVGHDESQ